MKKIFKIISVIGITALALTGCSSGPEDAVQKTAEEFYSTAIENSQASLANLQDSESLAASVDPEYSEQLNNTVDPLAALESLPEDQKTKVLEFYKSIDPTQEYFSYDGMTESEQVVLIILNMLTSSVYAVSDPTTLDVNLPSDAITVSESSASFDFSSLEFKQNGEAYNAEPLSQLSPPTMTFKLVEGEWKIDGKKVFDSYSTIQ